MTKPFRASPFQIGMYLQCPQRYKFYNDFQIRCAYATPKPYFTIGENVHNSLKRLFEIEIEQRNWESTKEILKEEWRKNRKGFRNRDEEKNYLFKAARMLKLFCSKNDLTKNPLYLEDFHDCQISDELILLGKIDRIDEEPDGSLHIIDYKTGKERENDEKIQQIIYPIIITKKMGKIVSRVSYLYLINNKFISSAPKEQDLDKGIERIQAIVAQIKNDSKFEPKPGGFCKNHCDFLDICSRKNEILDKKEKSHQIPTF